MDVAQAGPGDTVLVIDEGNGARQILGLDPGAVRAVVVGVVDEVTVGGVARSLRYHAGAACGRTDADKREILAHKSQGFFRAR